MNSTIQNAIVANFNQKLPREDLQRLLLDHPGWYGGGVPGQQWLTPTEPGNVALAKKIRPDLVGEPRAIEHLDDHLLALPDDLELLTIVPSEGISLGLGRDEIADLQHFARGYRVERAIHCRDYGRVREYASFLVPYNRTRGPAHQLSLLPTAHGPMVPAFTTADMAAHFLDTQSDDYRAAVRFATIAGDVLFGEVCPQLGKGVVVNIASAQAFGFDPDACRLVMRRR